MKRIEASPREELLIASSLGDVRGLASIIVAMVTLRVSDDALTLSKTYRDALDAVGQRYHPIKSIREMGSIAHSLPMTTHHTVSTSEMPGAPSWAKHLELLRDEITAEQPLVKYLEIAGYDPVVVLNTSVVFPDDYPKNFSIFHRHAGVQISFKRRPIGGPQ